jgi:hypothetical protein
MLGGLAPVRTAHGSYSEISFLKAIYADGGKGTFDAVAVHPYTFPMLPGTYAPLSGWSEMNETSPSLRSIMKSHGDGKKPIWITEFGAPSSGPSGVGLKGQAAEVKQAIMLARSYSWVDAIYIYSWRDLGTKKWTNADWFGLLTFGNKKKPSYQAVISATH